MSLAVVLESRSVDGTLSSAGGLRPAGLGPPPEQPCHPVLLAGGPRGAHLLARQHQYEVHAFDCSAWADEGDFHTGVSRALGFPAYYGRNLDAFNDCLGDIGVPDAGGTALVFLAFDTLHRKSPGRSWAILDVIACNSRRFLLTGQRLLALVQSDDTGLLIHGVGACPVTVNQAPR